MRATLVGFVFFLSMMRSQRSKYERGESEPPLDVLVKLRERFGKSLDWLVTGGEERDATGESGNEKTRISRNPRPYSSAFPRLLILILS